MQVYVVSNNVDVGDTIELEEHGDCEVLGVSEDGEEMEVKTSQETTVTVNILLEGDDEGEEIPE